MSFLPDYCHFFCISVTHSKLLSFLPNYCHFKYLPSYTLAYPKGEKIGHQSWPYFRVLVNTKFCIIKLDLCDPLVLLVNTDIASIYFFFSNDAVIFLRVCDSIVFCSNNAWAHTMGWNLMRICIHNLKPWHTGFCHQEQSLS